jgi:DNA-binding NtrC family response regulator
MTTSSRPRLLCVDDDASVLAALHRQLRHRYDVVLAHGAEEGLERLRDAGPFAVVMSDLHMPGLDGRAFLAEARTIAPRSVAVLMTGGAGADAGLGAGPGDLVFRSIAKPCLPHVLWASLDEAVVRHELDAEERQG